MSEHLKAPATEILGLANDQMIKLENFTNSRCATDRLSSYALFNVGIVTLDEVMRYLKASTIDRSLPGSAGRGIGV